MKNITTQVAEAVKLLLKQGRFKTGQIIVAGISTSEILGNNIGKSSSTDTAVEVWDGLQLALQDSGLYLAIQCCEHLNRALVVEEECFVKYSLEEVVVIPALKAGGAMAAYAYRNFLSPVVVENVTAHFGIDIGQTLIGMHLKPVAVPLRTTYTKIGNAVLTMAYSRPKLIGGERAKYCL